MSRRLKSSVKVVVFTAALALVVLGEEWIMREMRAELNYRRARDLTADASKADSRPEYRNLENALGYLSEAIRLAPDRAEYRYRMGQVLQRMAGGVTNVPSRVGDPETALSGERLLQAEEAYRRAAELAPNTPRYHLALAWARMDCFLFADHHFTRAEHAECERLLRRAMTLAPQDPDILFSAGCYYLLASCVLDSSLADNARKYFRRSAELNVGMLARILGQLWRYSQDVRDLAPAVPDTDEARRIFQRFIESHRTEVRGQAVAMSLSSA